MKTPFINHTQVSLEFSHTAAHDANSVRSAYFIYSLSSLRRSQKMSRVKTLRLAFRGGPYQLQSRTDEDARFANELMKVVNMQQ